MKKRTDELLLRVTHCLQTILELEHELERLEIGAALLKEFNVLKSFLLKIDDLDLQEEDVVRIESATESFLKELSIPLKLAERDEPVKGQLQ